MELKQFVKKSKVIIFIGAPGVGKTTSAQLLSKKLGAILIRRDNLRTLHAKLGSDAAYRREANITYAALLVMVKNYLKSGFGPIVIDDIMSYQATRLTKDFGKIPYLIVNLVMDDEQVQKKRVLAETRESVFRNWKIAHTINRFYQRRTASSKEIKIDSTHISPRTVVNRILKLVE